MGKEFKKKYMHPTRRKLLDMVHTGEYAKNTTIGYDKVEETRKVGDIWEDEHHKYEKKDGYILKTGKNSEALQEIRKYIEEKSKCKNSDCQTIKKTEKDKKFIQNSGYCMNCTIENEHKIRVSGLWKEYEEYKVFTRMIIFGKGKIEAYKESLDDVKEEYEMIGSDGKVTETWKLPKPVEEVKAEIQELIDKGEKELQEVIDKRKVAFELLREKGLDSYL
jgi:predicted DNA-binding transcriptional regulator